MRNFTYFEGIIKFDCSMVLYLLCYIETTKHINTFSPNVPLTEKLSSWFLLAKCVKKCLWNSERCYTLFYCDISTPLVRDVFKRKLYKDPWTKVYLTSALSWVRFHVTSAHHFHEEECPCISVKRSHPFDLITECPHQT